MFSTSEMIHTHTNKNNTNKHTGNQNQKENCKMECATRYTLIQLVIYGSISSYSYQPSTNRIFKK